MDIAVEVAICDWPSFERLYILCSLYLIVLNRFVFFIFISPLDAAPFRNCVGGWFLKRQRITRTKLHRFPCGEEHARVHGFPSATSHPLQPPSPIEGKCRASQNLSNLNCVLVLV